MNPEAGEIENKVFKYIFKNYPDGIVVRSGQKFDWSMAMYGDGVDRCYRPDDDDDYTEV